MPCPPPSVRRKRTRLNTEFTEIRAQRAQRMRDARKTISPAGTIENSPGEVRRFCEPLLGVGARFSASPPWVGKRKGIESRRDDCALGSSLPTAARAEIAAGIRRRRGALRTQGARGVRPCEASCLRPSPPQASPWAEKWCTSTLRTRSALKACRGCPRIRCSAARSSDG
jgi:hypothetical protein